jgi:exopolysaccharide biosynthesis protein
VAAGGFPQRRKRRRGLLVPLGSFALAAFTVFVLLDAFAIERVQQSVQEANLSSIVKAQGNAASASESPDKDTADAAGAKGESSGETADETTDGEAADSPGATDASDDKASDASADDDAGSNAETGGHHRKGHGSHGKPGSGGASDGSGKAAKGTGGAKASASAADDTIEEGAGSVSTAGTTVGSYSDDNMKITVSQVRAYDTDIYVADIQVSSAEYLKTALAQNAFGRNLKDTTSNMAEEAGAVLAINGDYYGFRDDGYVVRNGVLYRDTASAGTDALVVYGDGTMASASQDSMTAQQLVDAGAWQVLSFGPTLVENGALAVNAGDEVDRAMGSNPRTAIGMVDALHYIVVVSDGRTGDDSGLSLYQLAQVMRDNGATYAYNLDGGGSTTLYFKGEVLNNPSSGNSNGERKVSDIVYFG